MENRKIPTVWKQSVIETILKPVKDPSNPSSYRPIAFTSQLGKRRERMVTDRLTFILEKDYLLSPYQNGLCYFMS